MRRAAESRKYYLMRIRRRDKDPAETGGSEESTVLPYDYDQEHSQAADPVTNLIAEPTPAAPAYAGLDDPAESAPTPPADPPMETPSPAIAAARVGPEEALSLPDPPPAPTPDQATVTTESAPAHGAGPEETTAGPGIAEPQPAERPAAAVPKHAMRTPSIGDEATELLNGSKPETRELPRIIAIANQKGGVGKTTTTVNLGAALAELDYRVLVIDLDPQGNATTGLGVEARNFELSMYDVIMRDQPLEDCIEPTSVKNLFVAPATIDLAGVEIELVPAFSRELKLKRAIDTVVDDFDFVLIDCPPSLGLITVNGLAAADEVLVPIQCEYYALEGLSQLLRNVNLVSTNLNQTLEVSTIVLTMFDARTRLSVDVANEVREHFSERVCRAVIPRTVRLSEAPSFGQPITVFDPASRGAVAYRELAKEVSNGAPQRSR
jgi:chromosome partitioning protein